MIENADDTSGAVKSIALLKKKCDAIKGQLVDLSAQLTHERLEELDDADISVRLKTLERMYTNFESVHAELEQHDISDASTSMHSSFVALHMEVEAKLLRKMKSCNNAESKHSSTVRQFSLDDASHSFFISQRKRLPELQIPKFSGAYTDWPDFFAMFSTVINEVSDLTKIEKFQHLRASLRGAALDTIRSLEPTEANYDKALEILKNRFDNKLLNFQAHIKEIFGLKGVENGSAAGLRELSDKINAHLRALQTMGNREQLADGLLIHLISRKLDISSQSKWEEGLPVHELPTWSSMAKFLERRCRMLENLEAVLPTEAIAKKVPHFGKQSKHSLVASSAAPCCLFCDCSDHWIYNCSKFGNLSPALRYKEAKRLQLCLNCLRKGHSLQRCKSGHCRHCQSKHHSLLHMSNNLNSSVAALPENSQVSASIPTQSSLISTLPVLPPPEVPKIMPENFVLLATAIILVKNRMGCYIPCRALLDSASQINFITARLAQQLQLKTTRANTQISGIGESNFVADKAVDISAQSQTGDYAVSFPAVVTPTITDYQPNFDINTKGWNIPNNIKLADSLFFKAQRIDVLLGASLFFELMCVGQIRLANNLPILQKTKLGWVASGGSIHSRNISSSLAAVHTSTHNEEVDLDTLIKSFWEIENSLDITSTRTQEEIDCEQHFQQNYIRLNSGEYAVRLPIKSNFSALGDSYTQALQRFKNLERKLQRNSELKNQYSSFLKEYSELKHMSLTKLESSVPINFLPHHCVHKSDSSTTKLRVVFDGSAKTSSGYSLNDVLMTGPTIQPKLFNTLLRFRFFKVAITGDICKMYRCVRVRPPDNLLQCILWRENSEEEIQIFSLDTVTYGTKPAAFLAIRAMHQLALDEAESFPIGSEVIRRDFYVDDLISGSDTVEGAAEIRRQTTQLLQRGNFLLRKWCSNDSEALDEVPTTDREQLLKFHDGTDVTKTLGLVWDPKSDDFIFSFTPMYVNKRITKRIILSTIARFYDPLGLIGPIITKAKIFLQSMWKQKLQWDESLPQHLHKNWSDLCAEFDVLRNFHFPRYVSMPNSILQIHGFCDASLAAYGACVYIRSDTNNEVKISLLCSKSRVSPLKTLSVPKLELSAALLLSELLESVRSTYNFVSDVHCWSDSTVVLSWLREESSNFNIFVSNRVSRIQTLTNGVLWHHVPTIVNPADILSRGSSPKELLHSSLWKHGPTFLQQPQPHWPKEPQLPTDLPERRRTVLVSTSRFVDLSLECKYYTSYSKLQRIFAYVSRFWLRKNKAQPRRFGPLVPEDIQLGTRLLVRMIQRIHLAAEYKALLAKKCIESSSKLYSLNPFLDDFGLLRVGGRLKNSMLDFDARHPVILPKQHPVTIALVEHFHRKFLHSGPQSLLASIRLQFWPLGGRKAICSIVNKCISCFRLKPQLREHIMGDLPQDRVQAIRTFFTTGIDFCGPFYCKSEVRNKAPVKCYICVFICFATKATHLEVVCDLSTSSFLAALKRFICTRGRPKTIWSDNATNFVGAKNELMELKQLFMSEPHLKAVHQQCLEDNIEWRFIPPRSPHFGGLWEAAVKAAKTHFYRVVGLSILTFEELRTLVCQISAIINSRPLYPISENPGDLDVLTPAHFLVGAPFTSFVEPDVTHLDISRLDRWQRVCFMQQVFWKKWSVNYLTILQDRKKWQSSSPNIPIGAMVILKDENLPPLKWQLGRIMETICGSDGVARVVIVRTSSGTTRRAVGKVAVLPSHVDMVESLRLPTGGGCHEK